MAPSVWTTRTYQSAGRVLPGIGNVPDRSSAPGSPRRSRGLAHAGPLDEHEIRAGDGDLTRRLDVDGSPLRIGIHAQDDPRPGGGPRAPLTDGREDLLMAPTRRDDGRQSPGSGLESCPVDRPGASPVIGRAGERGEPGPAANRVHALEPGGSRLETTRRIVVLGSAVEPRVDLESRFSVARECAIHGDLDEGLRRREGAPQLLDVVGQAGVLHDGFGGLPREEDEPVAPREPAQHREGWASMAVVTRRDRGRCAPSLGMKLGRRVFRHGGEIETRHVAGVRHRLLLRRRIAAPVPRAPLPRQERGPRRAGAGVKVRVTPENKLGCLRIPSRQHQRRVRPRTEPVFLRPFGFLHLRPQIAFAARDERNVGCSALERSLMSWTSSPAVTLTGPA